MKPDHPKRPPTTSVDRSSIGQFTDISETLLNLIYLTQLEADRPEQVKKYMKLSEDSMRAMIEVLRSQTKPSLPPQPLSHGGSLVV